MRCVGPTVAYICIRHLARFFISISKLIFHSSSTSVRTNSTKSPTAHSIQNAGEAEPSWKFIELPRDVGFGHRFSESGEGYEN